MRFFTSELPGFYDNDLPKGNHMSLLDKLKKNSTIKATEYLNEQSLLNDKEAVPTKIPSLNLAFSGSFSGGFKSGLTMWAGESKSFKTMFSLIMAKSYLDKYPEGAILFYDSEFGSPAEYFSSVGIDPSKVIHTPIMDIEQLKFDIVQQLQAIDKNDRVFILIDSVGNLASKKEKDDAIDQKSVADMSRAKSLKSLFRMVTPYLTIKDIPMAVINHTYSEMGMFPKEIVSGGRGGMYSSDNVYIVSKRQVKDGTDLLGYEFVINVEKSRYVREKSKIPITVKFEGGVSKWSGLLELAMEAKVVIKPSNGWYSRVDEDGVIEDKKWRAKETDCSEFWLPVLENKNFKDWITTNYKISNGSILDAENLPELEE